MAQHIDYYASLNSPWTHLGAARIEALAAEHNATLRIWPLDFGTVFAGSGGLPLPKRSPQRQAYRMQELARWRDHLGIPITLQPRHFPANEFAAACCAIALRETQDDAAAIRFAHRVLKALWEEERDTGDPAVRQRHDARERPRNRLRLPGERTAFSVASCLVREQPVLATRLVRAPAGEPLERGLIQAMLIDGRVCLGRIKRLTIDPATFRVYTVDAFYRWLVAARGVETLIPG